MKRPSPNETKKDMSLEELDEIGELDPADMVCGEDYADDLGNLPGLPQQVFVEGREPLPEDAEGNVLEVEA